MGKLIAAGCGVLATLGVSGGIASAQTDHSVSGSCSNIQGTAVYANPVTLTAQEGTYDFSGGGWCDGTVDGLSISNARVAIHASGPYSGSCGSAESPAPGLGTLTWDRGTSDPRDDVSIAFTQEFTVLGTEADITYTGERFGSAQGHATFAARGALVDVAAQCAGEGVRELPWDGWASTDGPLGSGPIQTSSVLGAGLTVRAQPIAEVISRGLRARVTASESAESALRATASKRTARRLGLSSKQLGSGSATIPAGGGSVRVTLNPRFRAREALAKVNSATVIVSGTVIGSTGMSTVRERVRIAR